MRSAPANSSILDRPNVSRHLANSRCTSTHKNGHWLRAAGATVLPLAAPGSPAAGPVRMRRRAGLARASGAAVRGTGGCFSSKRAAVTLPPPRTPHFAGVPELGHWEGPVSCHCGPRGPSCPPRWCMGRGVGGGLGLGAATRPAGSRSLPRWAWSRPPSPSQGARCARGAAGEPEAASFPRRGHAGRDRRVWE